MTFANLEIKKYYSSDHDDILKEFYIPILSNSIEYCRLTGFFSSTSLAISAWGILGLIKNGGFMKLITSPKLNAQDYEVIKKLNISPLEYFEKKTIQDIESISDEFVEDHIFALGWMLANKKLEIKIAFIKKDNSPIYSCEDIENSGIFHIKIGIFTDIQGNKISFSGSVNESAAGWTENIEEFKVYRSWDEHQTEWLEHDVLKFNNFWNNSSSKVQTMDLPEAIKRKLIEIAPSDISKLNLKRWEKRERTSIKLFDYQLQAINNWENHERKGIFEMATGTGKTLTSLGCLNNVFNENIQVFAVIACPYKHLIRQWKKEIDKFGINYDCLIISDSSNADWKNILANALIDQKIRKLNKIITLTTHKTFSSDSFMNIIEAEMDRDISTLLIADEVHGIGSSFQKRGLDNKYKYRLGLSATPRRFFDDLGTKVIFNYFGETVFQFSLDEALNKINPATNDFYLTHYRYFPIFIKLSQELIEEYISQTKKIALMYSKTVSEFDKELLLTQLLNKRANIIKNAQEKYIKLREILNSFPESQKWVIIYCTPQQINPIMHILSDYSFKVHRFTMEEKTTPIKEFGEISERDNILNMFSNGEYQILVAMKILDEGVDVPQARTAILMASSENPREYIQRIGRVIRKYPNKTEATIYDIVAVPTETILPPDFKRIEKLIFEKQLERCEYIAKLAINSSEALKGLYSFR